MSECNKYIFHTDLPRDTTPSDANVMHADPIWAGLTKSHHPSTAATFAGATGAYLTPAPAGFLCSEYLRPNAMYTGFTSILPRQSFPGIDNAYLAPKATYGEVTGVLPEHGFLDISNDNLPLKATYSGVAGVLAEQRFSGISNNYLTPPKASVYGTAFQSDDPTGMFANSMNIGLSGHDIYSNGSTTSCFTGVGTITQNVNAGFNQASSIPQLSANSCLLTNNDHYAGVSSYGYAAQHNFPITGNKYGLESLRNNSLSAAILDDRYLGTTGVFSFDTWINPRPSHQYTDGTACLKMFETPNDYLGYSEQVGRRTKELLALQDQLSLLNEEAVWLNSKVTDDFYKSIFVPYGQDLFTYLQSWSEQVKIKIQKVVEKFDRLCKYIIKLKIGAGTIRRINKRRVFRTKVNLIFKNLDDAHPSELNLINSATNVIYQIFKYNSSWKLTYNN